MLFHKQQGFSLLELVIYLGILSGMMVVISNTFIDLSKGRGRVEARNEVNAAIRFVTERMVQDAKGASALITPTLGMPGSVLRMTVGGTPATYDMLAGVLRRTKIEAVAGTLVCSVKASSQCTGVGETVIYRMSGASNAHAERHNRGTTVYADNAVCCTLGVVGLGNSCSGTFATALNLQGVGNSHVQQNSQSNYGNSACISVPSGGTVSVGYQPTNCAGFDTILGSMTGTTNAHVGNTTAYPTKICARATVGAAPEIQGEAPVAMISPNVSVTSATFTRLENYNTTLLATTTSVQVEMTFRYNSTSPDWNYSSTLRTTISLR